MALMEPDEAAIAAGAKALAAGRLVAFPTETVYGLGANALDPDAVAAIFAAKGRPTDHPLICHVASADALAPLVAEVTPAARALASAFWPGPLTLVMPRSRAVPDAVTGGRDTVAVRVPAHPVALALLRAFDGPVAAPSANRFGRPSPTTASDVADELGDAVAVILDGGPCEIGIESTVVDLTCDPPQVLRPGRISAEQVAQVLGGPVDAVPSGPARAPGMLESHYAPGARVEVVAGDQVVARAAALDADGMRVAVLAPDAVNGLPAAVLVLGPVGGPDHYAARLYAAFRRADAEGAEVILAVPPPAEGIGVAVRDRLQRASAGR
jgi:L-threonylcarbamoyladenylate synthase